MAFHRFITRCDAQGSRSRSTATASRRATSPSCGDAVAATAAAATGRAGPRLQRRRRLARVDQSGARHHRPGRRPAAASRREPAQKGTCGDTFADTSLARADLGFAPTVSLEEGIAAEYQMAFKNTRAPMRTGAFVTVVWRCSMPARRCQRAPRGPKKPPVGTLEPDKFLFGNAAPKN